MVPALTPSSTHAVRHVTRRVSSQDGTKRVPGHVAVQGLPGLWNRRNPAHLGDHSKRTDAPRRVNRLTERDEDNVLRAVPEGSCPLTTDFDWLDAIRQHPKLVWHRADFRRNLLAVGALLLLAYDYNSHTVTPGNDYLMAAAGIGAGTLGRIKRWLRRHGFLGVVAGGRSAIYTPKTSDGNSNLFKEGPRPERMADRAVYVLCRLATEEELAEFGELEVQRMDFKCKLDPLLQKFRQLVDINGNPNQPKGKSAPKGKKEWASPTLKAHFEAAARETAKIETARTDLQWPITGTTSAPDEATRSFNELQAARTVQWHSPPLRQLPSTHLARMLAPFFRDDYSPRDILSCLDKKPDGTSHQHDGFDGARNTAALLQSRLNHWRLNGQPIYPPSKQAAIRSQEAITRAIAAAKEAKKHREPNPDEVNAFKRGIALVRSVF